MDVSHRISRQISPRSAFGQTPPEVERFPEADHGLHRYMLGIYEYVSCGLAVTGFAAYVLVYSGFHEAMMQLTPPLLLPFVWIFLLAPLALVLLLYLSIETVPAFLMKNQMHRAMHNRFQ